MAPKQPKHGAAGAANGAAERSYFQSLKGGFKSSLHAKCHRLGSNRLENISKNAGGAAKTAPKWPQNGAAGTAHGAAERLSY